MIPMNMKNVIESLADSDHVRYAAKYPIESHMALHGIWQCDVYRKGQLISGGYPEPPNTFTTEGIARILNIIFHDISKTGAEIMYVGIFKNNVTPAVGNTAAACLGAAGTYGACQETTDMDEDAFQAYTTVDTATATITNSATGTADFTIAATITLYGAFMTTISDPTSTTGYLIAAKKFTSSRSVIDNDAVSVTYTISVTTS